MRNLMTAAAVVAVLACPCLDGATRALAAQATQTANATEDTTFYRVPLMCPAARGLGCGSRAKPVLLDLQKRPIVQEAWLNQTGDMLAVIWTPGRGVAERQSVLAAVAASHGLLIDELDAPARDAARGSFLARTGWHRGTDVDQLSSQEARVIADRLLRRVTASTPTVQRKIAAVEPALTEAIRHQLVRTRTSPHQCRDALLAAARPHLDKAELAALKIAIERGFRPAGDEQ
jgi:hypothetical protein